MPLSLFGDWQIKRGRTFAEARAFYKTEIIRTGQRMRGGDEVRRHILSQFYASLIEYRMKKFDQKREDPDGKLARLKENSEIVPETYYIRVGDFYAIYERYLEAKEIHKSLFYRNDHRSMWLKKFEAESDQQWEIQP